MGCASAGAGVEPKRKNDTGTLMAGSGGGSQEQIWNSLEST